MPAPAGGMAVDALPGRQERGERALVGGLDLLAQRGERRAAQAAQDLGVAPLALASPPGRSSPRTSSPSRSSALERRGRVDAVAGAQLGGRERAVGARVARDELGAARRGRRR